MSLVIVNAASDEVGVCLEDAPEGASLEIPGHGVVVTLQQIPAGHKVALEDIAAGAAVHKYGEVIGVATEAIPRGGHVHVHNLRSSRVG